MTPSPSPADLAAKALIRVFINSCKVRRVLTPARRAELQAAMGVSDEKMAEMVSALEAWRDGREHARTYKLADIRP